MIHSWITYKLHIMYPVMRLNPFNAELNPISHLLALLGAHDILHVSRVRVNLPLGYALRFSNREGICLTNIFRLPLGPTVLFSVYIRKFRVKMIWLECEAISPFCAMVNSLFMCVYSYHYGFKGTNQEKC